MKFYYTGAETIPEGTTVLYCNKWLTSLPPLPAGLQKLHCDNNTLTSLPSLPEGLQALICNDNQLTSLPSLPEGLQALICNDNQLTSLPPLPNSLLTLNFNKCPIKKLPKRPEGLRTLCCFTTSLTPFPVEDLPNSLDILECYSGHIITDIPDCKKCENPSLFSLSKYRTGKKIRDLENEIKKLREEISFIPGYGGNYFKAKNNFEEHIAKF
jgi:Leucine-rich repeat (LRR) protein